jgi:hypothetical protein
MISFEEAREIREAYLDGICENLLECEGPGPYCMLLIHRDGSCQYFDAEILIDKFLFLCEKRHISIWHLPEEGISIPCDDDLISSVCWKSYTHESIEINLIPVILNRMLLFKYCFIQNDFGKRLFISKPLNYFCGL